MEIVNISVSFGSTLCIFNIFLGLLSEFTNPVGTKLSRLVAGVSVLSSLLLFGGVTINLLDLIDMFQNEFGSIDSNCSLFIFPRSLIRLLWMSCTFNHFYLRSCEVGAVVGHLDLCLNY